MKKIRFYHWWIYRLYYWLWTPILASRPDMIKETRDWMTEYLQKNGFDNEDKIN